MHHLRPPSFRVVEVIGIWRRKWLLYSLSWAWHKARVGAAHGHGHAALVMWL